MHDVTKRGLALAVATGGLLITGAAPALSAVSPHPGHPDQAGKKSLPSSASSHQAAAPVTGTRVEQQYVGRHKAPDQPTAATRHTAAADQHGAAHNPAASHQDAVHPSVGTHSAGTHSAGAHSAGTHSAGMHRATTAHHPAASHPAATHHTSTAQHGAAPAHHAAAPPAGAAATQHRPHRPAVVEAQGSDFGGGGLLAGNTVEVPVDAPVNVCGLVTTVLGGGDHAEDEHCVNGSDVAGGPSSSAAAVAAGNPGTLSGNVVQVPVSLPVNLCGDTVTAVGGHDSAEDIFCANEGDATFSTAKAVAAGSPGLVSGNVVQVPVDAPLNVCGITANVVGVYDTAAGNTCVNGGHEHGHGYGYGYGHEPAYRSAYRPATHDQSAGAGADAVTANSTGAVTGNIVQVPIEAPLDACGDSVNVVGVFNSALDNHCVNHTAGGSAARGVATGSNGLVAGNVAQLPVDIPTEVCGVVVAVGAYHDTAAGNTCANTGAPTAVSSAHTAGETGIITGNAMQGSLNTPVQLCGTTIGAGFANSGTEDTGCTNGGPLLWFPPPPPPCHEHLHHEHLHRHRHHVPPQIPPQTPHEEIGRLPHTGTDVLDYAGIAAGALVLGAGAVVAGRRKSGSAN